MTARSITRIFSCLTLFLVCLVFTGTARASFDVRDWLPEGELFRLVNLSVNWNGEDRLSFRELQRDEEAEVLSGLNQRGQLAFMASFSEADMTLRGTIDVLGDGRPLMNLDVWDPAVSGWRALTVAQLELGNSRFLAMQKCDCADRIAFCNRGQCQRGDNCKTPSEDKKCKWFDPILIYGNQSLEAAP